MWHDGLAMVRELAAVYHPWRKVYILGIRQCTRSSLCDAHYLQKSFHQSPMDYGLFLSGAILGLLDRSLDHSRSTCEGIHQGVQTSSKSSHC